MRRPPIQVKAEAASAEAVPPGYKRTEAGVIPEDWELPSDGASWGKLMGGSQEKLAKIFGSGRQNMFQVSQISKGYGPEFLR